MPVTRVKYTDYYKNGNTKYSVGVKRKTKLYSNTEKKCFTNCNQALKNVI